MDEKSVPMGVPPIVSFCLRHPHVIPLHQSAPWDDSLKHAALLLFRSFRTVQPIQYGVNVGKACVDDRAHRCPVGPAQSCVTSRPQKGVFEHSIAEMQYCKVGQFVAHVAMESPHRPHVGS